MACGVEGRFPDPEGRVRCNRAVAIAQQKPQNTTVVFGAGNGKDAQKGPDVSQKRVTKMVDVDANEGGVYDLATAAAGYCDQQGWKGEVLVWGRYDDTTTVKEIIVLLRAYRFLQEPTKEYRFLPRPVTSWWHAPRVWLICLIVFWKPVRVYMSRSALPWRSLMKMILMEVLSMPFSCVRAVRERHHGFLMWWDKNAVPNPYSIWATVVRRSLDTAEVVIRGDTQ